MQKNLSPDPDFESDEGLEARLHIELIEIAYSNGVSDPETLRLLLPICQQSNEMRKRLTGRMAALGCSRPVPQ